MNRNPNVRNGAKLNVRLFMKSLAVFILFMLASPSLAQFSVPIVTAGGTVEITDNSAWVYAEINAGGRNASVVFEYTTDPAWAAPSTQCCMFILAAMLLL
jgi:hypothetical protein